ncbi:class F sortase, partial [Streptacidiphilus neutrinimicus]|uniref:class F sortase n=1 Tax=Streptacidiphilus neutrinimicus TaxID=105420 RepID=UPI001F22AAC8
GGVSVGLLAVALGGVVYGVGGLRHTVAQATRVARVADSARSGSGSDAVMPARPAASSATGPSPLPASTPLALAIPSVRLNAPLLGLGMDGKGAAELPPFSLPRTAGWLRDSASPGEAGTAVVVGHVDTTTGPAVFWDLAAVRPGAEVDVSRLDGRTAVFTVDRVQEFPKAGFPAAQVYGPAPGAQLRVVTCGGGFDRSKHEYTGNVVLFAHLSGVR